jgi:N-acetylneuraminic acid mutarotase
VPVRAPARPALLSLVALAVAIALGLGVAGPSAAHPFWIASPHPPTSPRPAVTGSGWSTGPALPLARGEAAGAVLTGILVVLGGITLEGSGADERIRTLDMAAARDGNGEWLEFAPMPNPRDHLGAAVWNDTLYVSGGSQLDSSVARGNLWALDPMAGRWGALDRMPAERYSHAMVALDGVLYVVGGVIDGTFDHRPIWAYDVARGTWRTDLAPMPTFRDHAQAVAVDGRILVMGGRDESGNLATVDIYDPATDSWSAGPPMTVARSGFAAAVLPDGVHVAGGEDLITLEAIGSHEVLDLETATWTALPDLPTPRHGLASGVVDGSWIVVGGGTRAGVSVSDVVEVWTPGT